ncbi:UbiA family prenyltransferase [Nocardioides sp. NPDC127503]|uniref:UbiA family prenyltransferase n=1 Tax=Nocardioides sp. NPDC127503 TaxID=3154516 RepID=UPI0033172B5C
MANASQSAPKTIFTVSSHAQDQDPEETQASASAVPDAPAGRASVMDKVGNWAPFLLIRSAHPRQAVLTAIGLSVAAVLAGLTTREVALIAVTVLVGQAVLGWHNDLVDQVVDRRHERQGKPISDGRLEPGGVWFALCCGVLLVIPLSVTSGTVAGLFYLGSLVIGMLANVLLRKGLFSWVLWAAAFACYPGYLSYAGWAGESSGGPPHWVMVVLAAALGVGVHFLTALWGLVADNEDKWTYLPLKAGLKLGAGKLLLVTLVYIAAVIGGMLYAASVVGLRA